MQNVRCYRCGTLFAMEDGLYNALSQNGADFTCPSGHVQHFTPGLSADKKRIAELERRLSNAESDLANSRTWRCAWCEKIVNIYNIYSHLRRHGFPGVRDVRAAEKAAKTKKVKGLLPEKASPSR